MSAEKQQLRWLGLGLSVIGVASWWAFGLRPSTGVVLGLAGLALMGWGAYPLIGRSVFLVFSLLALGIGRVVSWLVMLSLYVLVIGVLGSILRLCKMDRLQRDFDTCKRKETMFVDVPPMDAANLRRQS